MAHGKSVQPKQDEVVGLAEQVLLTAGRGKLTDASRARLQAELAKCNFASLRAYPGSLVEDPAQAGTYYLAADAKGGSSVQPMLLQLSQGPAAASGRFANPVVDEVLHLSGGREVGLKAYSFSSYDREAVATFARDVEPAFLPRPQRALPAIATGNRHPEISLPAAFTAFGMVLEKFGANWASTVQLSATREMTTDDAIAARSGDDPVATGHTRVSIRHLYHAGLWAAIRAGWRAGYTAEADHFIVSGSTDAEIARSVEMVKEAIRHAAGYTKFTTDTSRLFELESDLRHPQAWSASAVEERFHQIFSAEEARWVMAEFSQQFHIDSTTYDFSQEEILRLAVKFGRSIKLNEELFDSIRAAKAALGTGTDFDFEPSLDEAETLTTTKELLFYMHWLKAHGRPAQLVPPNLGFKKRQAYPVKMETTVEHGKGLEEYSHHKMWPELVPNVVKNFASQPLAELASRVAALAAVARYFDGTLSIHSGSGKQAEVLEAIGRSTRGRVNYKISGELQLQLFDVLSEQPAGSPWRLLFERMVNRARHFAEKGAFGVESELADYYVKMGREFYLGNAARGRVDGNLFQVFWLGNVVGSRDTQAPDGDHRFFKEKLDELPDDLLAEVRRRNSAYIVWLVEHLRG
ncbi:MAG: tagaturonate epimerase family protein [Acidobacteriota bacterium]|nr:tagaturonate epimerase family protein [Acidobacteriota bacterium]